MQNLALSSLLNLALNFEHDVMQVAVWQQGKLSHPLDSDTILQARWVSTPLLWAVSQSTGSETHSVTTRIYTNTEFLFPPFTFQALLHTTFMYNWRRACTHMSRINQNNFLKVYYILILKKFLLIIVFTN